MKMFKKMVLIGGMALLMSACHEEEKIKRENPMLQPAAIAALKTQVILEGSNAKVCGTAMSDPKHHDADAFVCKPWIEKQFVKYKTGLENRNRYAHEHNSIPVREDFNDPVLWTKLLALWEVDRKAWLAEHERLEKERLAKPLPKFF
jgi:hypothetical protein